ncbi:hypothetical protein EYF80_059480 [Liparis tanakae]|uniref:Uncharacterized protein n=1 Tax=Liparis tanakae TaxID=230148 RepID=A0A4Z2ENK2_9TELE|nr:hypothetical protein EYF80_059480 [Liparis tanakae]
MPEEQLTLTSSVHSKHNPFITGLRGSGELKVIGGALVELWWSSVELCGALWSSVELCGALVELWWSSVERWWSAGGALWSSVELCGLTSRGVFRVSWVCLLLLSAAAGFPAAPDQKDLHAPGGSRGGSDLPSEGAPVPPVNDSLSAEYQPSAVPAPRESGSSTGGESPSSLRTPRVAAGPEPSYEPNGFLVGPGSGAPEAPPQAEGYVGYSAASPPANGTGKKTRSSHGRPPPDSGEEAAAFGSVQGAPPFLLPGLLYAAAGNEAPNLDFGAGPVPYIGTPEAFGYGAGYPEMESETLATDQLLHPAFLGSLGLSEELAPTTTPPVELILMGLLHPPAWVVFLELPLFSLTLSLQEVLAPHSTTRLVDLIFLLHPLALVVVRGLPLFSILALGLQEVLAHSTTQPSFGTPPAGGAGSSLYNPTAGSYPHAATSSLGSGSSSTSGWPFDPRPMGGADDSVYNWNPSPHPLTFIVQSRNGYQRELEASSHTRYAPRHPALEASSHTRYPPQHPKPPPTEAKGGMGDY